MGKVKNYIMTVEEFVNDFFDYETETFKTDKQDILLKVRGEFGDSMSVEIAKDYVDRDFPNEFFMENV